DAQQGAFARAIEADDANLGAIKIRQADVAQDLFTGWVGLADTDHGINDFGIHVCLTSQPVSQGASRCVFQWHASRVAHVVYYIPHAWAHPRRLSPVDLGSPAGVPLVRGEFLRGTWRVPEEKPCERHSTQPGAMSSLPSAAKVAPACLPTRRPVTSLPASPDGAGLAGGHYAGSGGRAWQVAQWRGRCGGRVQLRRRLFHSWQTH